MTAPMQIPPVKISFSDGDRAEILARIDRCLAAGFLAQGENVEEFEASFARYVGCRHAVALSSGGSAIEAGMRALDVGGREVLVPTNTFFATAAAVLAAGGTVRLVDIDPETLSPGVETIEAALTKATAGLILVHVGGIISRDIEAIRSLCDEKGIWLFEDCAHAHGSALAGRRAGRFGVAGAYSFFSTKVITSGEGGMLVTDDDELGRRVRLLRNYGKPDPWETRCVEFGLNWRLNELAAIVGMAQLRRLDEFTAWRARLAARYTAGLSGLLEMIQPAGPCSWYKYIAKLPPTVSRQKVRAFARERGVALSGGVYDLPLHQQPVAVQLALHGSFPHADDFCSRHICLPVYYGMTDAEADYVIETMAAALPSLR